MSGVSLPVTRPSGQALLVGNPASRGQPLALLTALGFKCEEEDDPYIALLELLQRPLVYHAVVLSISSLYREELQVIRTIKRHFPQIDIWLAQTDGRHAAMAEAIRLGADGLLSEEGLHRTGMHTISPPTAPGMDEPSEISDSEPEPEPNTSDRRSSLENESAASHNGEEHDAHEAGVTVGEPVLSADELRALLQEQPFAPPRADEL